MDTYTVRGTSFRPYPEAPVIVSEHATERAAYRECKKARAWNRRVQGHPLYGVCFQVYGADGECIPWVSLEHDYSPRKLPEGSPYIRA